MSMELLDLHSLTKEERNTILSVLRRDEDLRRRQDMRISQVKQELHQLRMSSVLRSGDDLSKMCARCKAPFGRLTNTGEVCPVCHFRVCKDCRQALLSKGWLCSLCFKDNQLRWLTGDWMVKEAGRGGLSRFNSGTDLVRASLRVKRPNGRLSSDFTDYDSGPEERITITKGHLGGRDQGPHAGPRGSGAGVGSSHPLHESHCPPPGSPDTTSSLTNLFHSIRSGLGGGGGGSTEDPGEVGAVGGSEAGGGGVVVQHVSCRRRHDSNSSSSDSNSQGELVGSGGVKKQPHHPKTNGTAVEVRETTGEQHKGSKTERESGTSNRRSGELDPRALSHAVRSEGGLSGKDRHHGRAGEGTVGTPEAKARSGHHAGRRGERPQPLRGVTDSRQKKEAWAATGVASKSLMEEERCSSGCSFTSSEWGDVTPTESSAPQAQDRKEDVGSTPGQSSGYASTSRKSQEGNLNHVAHQHNHDNSPSPSKSKASPSKLPVTSRQLSRDSSQQEEEPPVKCQPADRPSLPQQSTVRDGPGMKAGPRHGHVRRQSSGRSETLSTSSANTASPTTKLRLLDLASTRALERDEEDSVQSWSGASEDTLSLGMSCTGLPVSAHTPVFQKVHRHKHPKGCEEGGGQKEEGRTAVKSEQRPRLSEGRKEAPLGKDRFPGSQGTAPALSVCEQAVLSLSQTTSLKPPDNHAATDKSPFGNARTELVVSQPTNLLQSDHPAQFENSAVESKPRTSWGKLKRSHPGSNTATEGVDDIAERSSKNPDKLPKQSEKNEAEDSEKGTWSGCEDGGACSQEESDRTQNTEENRLRKDSVTAMRRKTDPHTLSVISESSELDCNEPALTDCSEPALTDCSEPALTDCSEPALTDCSEPALTDCSEPALTDCSEPALTDWNEPPARGRGVTIDMKVPQNRRQQEQDYFQLGRNQNLGLQEKGRGGCTDPGLHRTMQRTAQGSTAAPHKDAEEQNSSPGLGHNLNSQAQHGQGGGSDQSSDTGGTVSPSRGGSRKPSTAGSTPQKSSLSIPSVVATSHSGSNDERSVDDDDDDIDELFNKYRSGSQLGISRSSIGSSRESLASVYSDAGEFNYGRIPVSGEIAFGLEFDPKLSALRIHIKGCKDLAPVNVKRHSSDPYVKVYLLPDKTRTGKQKSKIKKHTLNPVFNETLTYNISQGELENRTLWLTVWHNDRLGRNDFLGEVTIPMDMYRFDDPSPCIYPLQSRTPDEVNEEAMQYKGDLVVSLKYVTPDKIMEGDGKKSKSKKSKKSSKAAQGSLGEIHVWIKSACNISAARSNGMSDPFVKGYLLPDQGKTSKQKTPVVKNSVNPSWDHCLVFDGVDPMEMAERCLELTVWDHETLGTNQFLGGVRLNLGLGSVKGVHADWMDARGQESIVWQNMMEQPNSWVDATLPLRPSMGRSNAKK